MTTSVRPTQIRLLLALPPAVIIVALMLQALAIMLYTQTSRLDILSAPSRTLSVLLSRPDITPETTVETEWPATRENVESADHEYAGHGPGLSASDAPEVESRMDVIDSDSAMQPRQSTTKVDWNRLAKAVSAEYMAGIHANERLKAERWRNSGSVLFAPRDDMPVAAESDVLLNYRFLEPVGVLGLGLTIGQCFVGVPLIGIPVEDRTPVITLIHCRR